MVINGLILYLDAANDRSYSGTGSSWLDLSKSQQTATLTNGPTFNTQNGGSILLDGSNDFILCQSSGTNIFTNQTSYTVSFWLRETTYDGFGSVVLSSAGASNLFLQITSSAAYIGILGAVNNYLTLPLSLSTLTLNKITNFVFVKDGNTAYLYINDVRYTFPGTANFNFVGTDNTFNIGKYTSGGFELTGNLYSVSIYNRALSVTEVSQCYNTTKKRFGL